MKQPLSIIGGGLAGCEAAWQAAGLGVAVRLFEMRPATMTPAHKTGNLAELVCSNSLRGDSLENAVGLLKEEMRRLGSLIMAAADACRLPAGGALAVDRENFSGFIEEKLRKHPLIEIELEEFTNLGSGELTVIAAGPLASPGICRALEQITGGRLFFHDAIAPIIERDSIDLDRAFFASRYGKGRADYLNCPLNREEYLRFWQALREAELYPLHDFEAEKSFEGCLAVETMAARGPDTLRFGPLKPVGLELPGGGEAYAVVQLRQDNAAATAYNLVGFQTRLRRGEQERVFRLIPGLEQAVFLRYGMMHRNTYLDSPRLLAPDLSLLVRPNLFLAGQISGVEGYVESAAGGLAAGINAARRRLGQEPLIWPAETAVGGLVNYLLSPRENFQPTNITFALLPPLEQRIRDKREKNRAIAARALKALTEFATWRF
ncbi:MAG: methylenetetrahydrofolate--tRNA-(uracil(54)-C(5))-methyltransferase (FADH(2)-oxidizing) TrmFO [Clostridiales bacterium]|nr:methylenetetrahydrofolate--tRNA-(uracil(54)-C(5))-methyltransferase (FADH(2)-oxidizing) TrmFO [Clostridiales bacterium]